ncbi:hypothetical protein L1987_66977 [Smallanthus sonchifolius]|uniref:Uncharacterized protein n=1 Tax=Smallanthus sonchifolius TaxID=185202 RepID=A0ACB9BZ15_9ASTR|nr:hypothetical protein L1987_66977 [Smallanthus sonchifolius]
MNTSSSTFSNSYSFTKPNINQGEWVESMRKSVCEHDDEEIGKIPVSIFSVPAVLLATDPNSYIPQQVALGPFHHWRPEVYDMQRYKLAAARRTQKYMNISFERIVEIMKEKDEAKIRPCYHKFIDMSADALIWMMAVDMAFLLEFLVVYSMREQGRTVETVTSSMSHLVDVSGKKPSHMAILRDMTMLTGLYHELSPFHEQELADVRIEDCDHILDFLYHMTVPNCEEQHVYIRVRDRSGNEHEGITEDVPVRDGDHDKSSTKCSDVRRFTGFIGSVFSRLKSGFVKILKKIIFGKPVTVVMKLPWKILSSLPILKLMKEPIENMLENFRGEGGDEAKDDTGEQTTPTIEEITIPSVIEMAKAGIRFSPVNGGISDISFDVETRTLYLPVVELDMNTEVYLRNLVAYEACVAAGPLVVARYTELMNGIVDTEEDAEFLRKRGIVVNHLKSDKEVADLWNGMSKSVKLTKVEKMDKVIEDVNNMYGKTWRVKLSKFMKTYVFASWQILTLLAALCLLFLTTVQAFCSVYSCARVLKHLPEIPGSEGTAE